MKSDPEQRSQKADVQIEMRAGKVLIPLSSELGQQPSRGSDVPVGDHNGQPVQPIEALTQASVGGAVDRWHQDLPHGHGGDGHSSHHPGKDDVTRGHQSKAAAAGVLITNV